MGCRRPNPRLAKTHRSYTVEEVSWLFSIHKNTVRNWLRRGLASIDDKRPTVIRGSELRRFLFNRRALAKQVCGPGRIYCLPCREPKVPAGNMVECIKISDVNGSLRGTCPDCDRIIYRRINPKNLSIVCGDLNVTFEQDHSRIEEITKPNVICDSTGK